MPMPPMSGGSAASPQARSHRYLQTGDQPVPPWAFGHLYAFQFAAISAAFQRASNAGSGGVTSPGFRKPATKALPSALNAASLVDSARCKWVAPSSPTFFFKSPGIECIRHRSLLRYRRVTRKASEFRMGSPSANYAGCSDVNTRSAIANPHSAMRFRASTSEPTIAAAW